MIYLFCITWRCYMATDSIKIYINGLRTKRHFKQKSTLEEAIFFNGFVGFKFKQDDQNPYLSYYDADMDGIYIKYFPYRKKGELRIKFNIPKLMAGTNLCSIFLCNTQQIFERLCFKLWPLIDLVQAPHLRFWYTSEVEVNTDIIMYKQQIDAIYNVLQKISATNQYIMEKEYDDGNGGKSIYFILKNTKFETSDIVVKFYKKVPEMTARDNSFSLNDVYSSKGIVNLKPQQSVLRMEVEIKRDKIYELFKPQVLYSTPGSIVKYDNNIGTFEDVFTMDYQCYILNGLLREFNLDKMITTPKTLRKLIRSNDGLSDKQKKKFWNVIQHENTDCHKKKPPSSVRKECINLVLSQGYNYLYADTEIKPVSIANIIRGLPEVQQIEIALYKNSSIYKDIWLSRRPNPRVYKGKHR